MKNNHILTLCIAALIGAGCSDDQIINDSPLGGETEARTLRIGAGFAEGSTTRLGYNETDDAINLTWTADDMLQLYSANNGTATTPCVLVEGAGTTAAQFELVDYMSYTQGETLYALYCKGNLPVVDADGDLTVSVEGQTGQLDERFQLMWGSTTYKEGTNPYFAMKHLTSIVKVTIPSEKSLQSVTLKGGDLSSKGTLVCGTLPSDAQNMENIKPGDVVYSYEKGNQGKYGDIDRNQLTVTGPFEPENGVVTVYFYVLPVKTYWPDWYNANSGLFTKPSVSAVNVDSETLVSTNTYSNHELKAGKVYELHPSMFTQTDFSNEAEADGTVSQPYELWTADDLYNWMLRCKDYAQNAQQKLYKDCSYKLMADIELTNQMPWNPFYFDGTLDGNGKTLRGSITSTYGGAVLFDALNSNCVIKNLTLDFSSISFGPSYTMNSAVLCGNSYGATFIHCINRSSIQAHAPRVGGLVGYVHADTKLIACGNEGTISSTEEPEFMGGLIAESEGQFTMETCYNTGEVEVNASSIAGGLVGRMADGDNSVNACWTTSSNGIGLIGEGNCTNCYLVDALPTLEEIAAMNAAMQNHEWLFKETGKPGKNSSTTIPDIDEEEW